MEGGRPGEGRPTGVPADEPRGEIAAGWEGLVGERSPVTVRGEAAYAVAADEGCVRPATAACC